MKLTIINRKEDNVWAYAENDVPGGTVTEEQALKTINELKSAGVWWLYDEMDEYYLWRFYSGMEELWK